WGWRWTFLVNVPIAAAAMWSAYRNFPTAAWPRFVPEGMDVTHHAPDLDPVCTATFTVGTLPLMCPFPELYHGGISFLLLPIGVIILAWWVWWERRYKRRGGDPMVDMALFKNRSYRNGTLLIGLFFTGSTSVWVTVAIFLQTGHGISALLAALVGLPSA